MENIKEVKEITSDYILDELYKICSVYKDDDSYVYKLCNDYLNNDESNRWLVIMQKLPDTETNESRSNVVKKEHAGFRANKLKVIKIVDIYDPNNVKNSIISLYGGEFKDKDTLCTIYKTHKIVKPHLYDENIEIVCSGGIHYFKTLLPAYYFRDIPINYTGQWIKWYGNGQKEVECYYLNGSIDGLYISYWPDGSHDKVQFY